MLTLSPHPSRKLQPLDLTVFGPLKNILEHSCRLAKSWRASNDLPDYRTSSQKVNDALLDLEYSLTMLIIFDKPDLLLSAVMENHTQCNHA
jgi:hypothetical protein